MPLTPAELAVAVQGVTTRLLWAALHTTDPGATGANEATGGAYARAAVAFPTPAADGTSAVTVTINAPAGTVTHYALWSTQTAGSVRATGVLSAPLTTTAGDKVRLTLTVAGTTT